MANRHMKRCSTSLIIRKTHVKTTLTYRLTPVRMVIKKTRGLKSWCRCGEMEGFVQGWWECQLAQPPWKTAWRGLKKLKMELVSDAAACF